MEGSRSTIWPILDAQGQQWETLISIKSSMEISHCKIQRAPGKSCDRMSFLGASGGRIRQCWVFKNTVGRRRVMTLMYKVIVFKNSQNIDWIWWSNCICKGLVWQRWGHIGCSNQKVKERRENQLVKRPSWKLLRLCQAHIGCSRTPQGDADS